MLSSELIHEFKTIIQKEYDLELTEEEASMTANDLAGYFDLLAKIHHREYANVEDSDLVRSNGLDQDL